MTTQTESASPITSTIGERETALALLETGLSGDPAAVEELVLVRQRLAVTRFSNRRVHQAVEDASARLFARVWHDGGHGAAVSDGTTRAGVESAIHEARELAPRAQVDPLVLPGDAPLESAPTFHEATAGLDAPARAGLVASLLEAAGDAAIAGNIRVAVQDVTIVNSAGLALHVPLTYVAVTVTAVAGRGGTGYETAVGRDIGSLDVAALVAGAVETAEAAGAPIPLASGTYPVLLEPQAVSMLLLSVGYVGLNAFGAGSAAKGASFIGSNIGEKVAADAITLVDDPCSTIGLPLPVDLEGTPKKPLVLIERGIARAVAHDLSSARKAGVESTGHALPVGFKGPAPTHLAIEPGKTTRQDLVRGLERGLVVNRIHPFISLRGGPDVELSGTTRDGVFLVEKGEVVGCVRNLRWSAPMLELLRSVEAVSSERGLAYMDLPEYFMHTNHVPSLLCGGLMVHGVQPHECAGRP